MNGKIEEAKRKKNILVARAKRAEAHKTIQATMSGLSDTSAFDTFDRMAEKVDLVEAEAEAHAEEDKARREEAEVRNNADNLVFQTEKLLTDSGDKVEPAEREKIDAALTGLKEALAGTEVDAVRTGHEALIAASQEFAQRLYAASSASASAGADSGGTDGGSASAAPDDDEVAEAEIVDEPKS